MINNRPDTISPRFEKLLENIDKLICEYETQEGTVVCSILEIDNLLPDEKHNTYYWKGEFQFFVEKTTSEFYNKKVS